MLTDVNLLAKQNSELELNEQLVQACLDIDLINIERLLNEGANPNFLTTHHKYEEYEIRKEQERTFQTPLDILAGHYAYNNKAPSIHLNIADAARLLLEHGANVNGGKTGLYSDMPLHNAADNANLPLMQILVEWGANVNAPDCILGYTPLHIACGGYSELAPLAVVAFLIHHGADVNAESDAGKTPAHMIMLYNMDKFLESKYLPLLQALSYHGADFTIVDQEGQSPFSVMQNRSDFKKAIIDGLLTNNADANNVLTQQFIQLLPQFGLQDLKELSIHANKSIAMHILDKIIEAHLISIYPEHLLEHQLIQASIDVNLDKVATLLAQGADPNFISSKTKWDTTNFTALNLIMENVHSHYGAVNDTLGIMKLLLEHGANPNAAISTGNTPLHMLAKEYDYLGSTPLQQGIFDLLINFGADVNLQNNEGQTPAHLTLKYPTNIPIFKNLINEGANLTIENNDHKTVLDLAENNPAAQRIIKTVLPTAVEQDTTLSMGDIIHNDTQDFLFGESTPVVTVTPVDGEPTPHVPYEGYVPLFIMQWLGLEHPVSVNNISE